MKKSVGPLLFCLLAILTLLLAGCGSSNKVAESNGQNCVECHSDKEKLLADLKINPLPKKEKSAETSGEG
ncbi:MAG: hypothetical protein ACYC21_09320 [Eubacteriales bacterium]